MPTITYHRDWCKTCNDWTLFAHDFDKPKDWYCKACNQVHAPYKLSELPKEKLTEQRERFRKHEGDRILGIYKTLLTGTNSNPFSEDFPPPTIIEADAGQKDIDERVTKKVDEEKQRRKEEIAKYSLLKRNDTCICGSGKKYKKCCMHRIESY